MRLWRARQCAALLVFAGLSSGVYAHPLRLSLTQIEYSDERQVLSVSLRLFLMDVNEALVFDPDSTQLAFCQPDESEDADTLLLEYLEEFFYVKANGQKIDLKIKSKRLSGEGINVALGVEFEHSQPPPLRSLEIRNAVFTDLFDDQSNVIYVHVNGGNKSLMLGKNTPSHTLKF
jgi:hypothetical protein